MKEKGGARETKRKRKRREKAGTEKNITAAHTENKKKDLPGKAAFSLSSLLLFFPSFT